MPKPVVHFDIGCRDLAQTESFYTQLFDWTSSDYGPISKKIATGSDSGINGHLTALGHEPHNYVMVYVEVDDIKEHLERAAELGGSVVIPETEIPGGGRFAWFNDPDGNTIGLYNNSSAA